MLKSWKSKSYLIFMGNYLKTYKSQKNLCFGYKNYYVDEPKLITFIVIFACFLGIVLDESKLHQIISL